MDKYATEKKTMRSAMRSLLKSLNTQQEEGAAIAQHIEMWPLYQQAKTVACFFPMPFEVSTLPLLTLALGQGKILALPKVSGKNMSFYAVEKTDELVPGPFGILEPKGQGEPLAPSAMELMLIPALAVDLQGRRLGQGGGYYDRYLPFVHCPVAAMVMADQIVKDTPCSAHDYLIQWITTSQGIFSVKTVEA